MNDWIAIVDDDITNLRVASHILTQENMKVSTLRSGGELIGFLKGNHPDLILLDIMMPKMDGFETIRRLREIDGCADIPVIFLTGDEDSGTEAKGLIAGAADFIKKPFVAEILLLRIRQTLELYRMRNNLAAEVEKKTNELLKQHERIKGLKLAAQTDSLTGLLNKISSQEEIGSLVANTQGVLLMIDLDSFKLVNDLYGHEVGDKLLIRFADIIRSAIRQTDIAGRIGGDEFIAFCAHVTEESVLKDKTEYINKELMSYAKELMGEDMTIPLGASIGAVMCPDEGRDFLTLYQKADEALYSVKQNGKHSFAFFWTSRHPNPETVTSTSSQALMILQERSTPTEAMLLPFEQFRTVFRLIVRLKHHDGLESSLIHFTLNYTSDNINRQDTVMEHFLSSVRSSLRTGDTVTKTAANQCMALLVNTDKHYSDSVAARVINDWEKSEHASECSAEHEIILI